MDDNASDFVYTTGDTMRPLMETFVTVHEGPISWKITLRNKLESA